MTDFFLLEKLQRILKETGRPRMMFRKGISIKGYFRPYISWAEYTGASVFGSSDEITPVSVRFSSMLGDDGTPDTVRNIKGMDVKFKTANGSYDMMCRTIPTGFINDEEKLLQMIDTFSVNKPFDGIGREKFWSFVTGEPESFNCAIRFLSRQGLSDTWIGNQWFCPYAVLWTGANDKQWLVKYKWSPLQTETRAVGESRSRMDRNTAEFMAGFDPDRAMNGLKRAIAQGAVPMLELLVQLVDVERCTHEQYIKHTLVWSEGMIPYQPVGRMKLTELIEEEPGRRDLLSFAPGNTIPGIDLPDDGLLRVMDHMYRMEAMERGGML